jgi:hypothetical protein
LPHTLLSRLHWAMLQVPFGTKRQVGLVIIQDISNGRLSRRQTIEFTVSILPHLNLDRGRGRERRGNSMAVSGRCLTHVGFSDNG